MSTGSGSGCGRGSGFGSGDGYGCGSGDGYGYGCGDGSGFGYGSGDGSGSGDLTAIYSINGERGWNVDGVPTVLRRIQGNVAKGAILRDDLSLSPCYAVKQEGKFAHGETLRAAMEALRDKLFEDMPEEERIAEFLKTHKAGVKYPNADLYNWHHRLTGSCDMGRREFAKSHGVDVENGSMTVEEFIALTRNAYGGDVIRRVEEKLKEMGK